jgi:GTP-binding protein
MNIGQTLTNINFPVSLPKIKVEEPTIKVTIGPNNSPLSGREGNLCSSIQIKKRLEKEVETNLGLKISEDPNSSNYIVAGRGELHLSILIETMRREGFELSVSKPQVIYNTIDRCLCEPFEEVTIDIDSIYIGFINEEMAKRKAQLINMHPVNEKISRFIYKISTDNLLGIRNSLLTNTRGTATISSYSLGYFPKGEKSESKRNGVLIAFETGTALSFGLEKAQERGILFIGPGTKVYEGMIVGVSSRDKDMEINVCKGKKLTNVRSETADIAIQLTPPTVMDLEQSLYFINQDELIEVTPKNIRLRKKILSFVKRKVAMRDD